jgi:peptidoglycan LD-endopeptidase LytH
MSQSAQRSRLFVLSTMLGALLLASCIEVEDASDKKKATADSAAGAVANNATPATPVPPETASFGPDSATRIRGGPAWTAEQAAAMQSDSAHDFTGLDSTAASDGAPATPGGSVARRDSAAVASPATPTPLLAKGALLLPVQGVEPSALHDTYSEQRGGGSRTHEALDILAPRGTPVLSATSGRVLKLFDSKAGGKMVYAADSSERFILMYAHLDAYAPGLADGQPLKRGQVIGVVGTTGNAPPNVPHLHFAIARSNDVKVWWKGEPVNPFPLLAP